MRRMLEILVYGIIASAQLAVTLFLIGHFTRGAAPAVPARATHIVSPRTHPAQAAAASIMPPLSLFTREKNELSTSTMSYHVAPPSQIHVDLETFNFQRTKLPCHLPKQ